MNVAITAIVAVIIVLLIVAAWSVFVGGRCTKDSQCPPGYACSGGTDGGKCVPKGSFSVDPKLRASGRRGPHHPLISHGPPEVCAGPPAPLRERLTDEHPSGTAMAVRDMSGKRSGRVSAQPHRRHHPLMIASAPPPGGFMR